MRTRLANARWLGIALLGTAVAAAVAGFEVAHRAPAPAAVTAMPSPGPPPPVGRPAPSFDVVRVAPDGAAVLAGRATPGAEVTVTAGDRTVGLARANPDGAWLIAPSLPAGPAAVGVSERAPDGRVTAGDAPVLVVVPERTVAAAAQPPALAVMTPPLGPPRVLQAPGMRVARALALDTFDYDEHGAIRFSGAAPSGAAVRAYVDDAAVGDATADGEGRWSLSPPATVRPGMHRLRLDQISPEGRVTARLETPFERESLAQSQVAPGQVVVQPGQNLWRLARRAYGSGMRYTVIVLANRDQIRNASLIYPGQVFSVPAAAP